MNLALCGVESPAEWSPDSGASWEPGGRGRPRQLCLCLCLGAGVHGAMRGAPQHEKAAVLLWGARRGSEEGCS